MQSPLISPAFLPLRRISGRMLAGAAMLLALPGLQANAQAPAAPAAPAAGIAQVPPVVDPVDWQRYAGRWYELARLPNSFQRKCVADVTARYAAAADGSIRVVNQCRRDDRDVDTATGEARRVDGGVGKLKVRFAPRWLAWVPAVWGDYWVLGLDDDYRTALVGTPDREYLWLLSRTPHRPAAEIDAWLQRAAALGFDAGRVQLTVQTAESQPPPDPPAVGFPP